jgi:glycosyltransferase involved in cell wall biosynthesis
MNIAEKQKNANLPTVSILMLTYNRADYIGTAIKSVLAQTYQNFELIILDDGSTDETAGIVASFKDPRIQYHADTVNRGLIYRRAESLTYATGTYVAILDSDDIWTSNDKLATQVTFLEANPDCAVVGTQITLIDSTGVTFGSNSYALTDTAIRNVILTRNQFAHSSVLIRQSLLAKTDGYRPLPAAEDLDLFLQLGQYGTLANLPDTMFAYRVHNKGESAHKAKVLRSVLQVIKSHRHEYPNYFKGYVKYSVMLLLTHIRTR